MPRVPSYDNFQATPNTVPQAFAQSPKFAIDPGQPAKEFGQAATQFGNSLEKMAMDTAVDANQVRLDDAMNQAREAARTLQYDKAAGYVNLKGRDAMERPDGLSLTEEYGTKLDDHLQQIAGTLGNEHQKAAFSQFAGRFATGFKADVDRHFLQESGTYTLSVSEAAQKGAIEDIKLNWNNPDAINEATDRLKAEVYRQAKIQGKSAEWQDMQAKALTSTAHRTALAVALENNDPTYADAYLKRYSSQMTADDILTVKGHITKDMDARVGTIAAADVITNMQPRINVSDAERAFNVAVGTESGGRQFGANGQPLISPKGAIGIAQVMPDTAPEAAKLAGLPWDETRYKTDPTYNKAIGLAYFQQQLQTNSGDLGKAYAAYNAGPGALDKAVKQAEHEGGAWLSYLPKETQNYVAANLKAYDSGAGKPARPTFAEIDDQLRADPRLADNPERYKIARDDAARRFDEQTKAIKQREEEATATAMQTLLQNGGDLGALDSQTRNAIPGKDLDNVMTFAQKVAKGQPIETDWGLYYQLKSDPGVLKSVNLMAVRDKLNDSEFKALAEEQQGLNSGNQTTTSTRSAKDIIEGFMLESGINPNTKVAAEAKTVGRIWSNFDKRVAEAEQDKGGKLSPEELKKVGARMFTSVPVSTLISSEDKPAVLVDWQKDSVKVPNEDRQQIVAAWNQRNPNKPITDREVFYLYAKRKGLL